MAILSGLEHDIFISYRQNDNRSGWVTEFVNHLNEELAATIKEPVSVYFDSNPHNGLLEIHNVDKSLEGKLKCLIFIPILSQTYCDPKSFAWQHEFCAFNKLASSDSFGRDIKLANGNVTSRILPIKIHELDAADQALIENETGSVLRAVDFIYKEPGVNRPLLFSDSRNQNQNKTDYRNQINKVANGVKEILQSFQNSNPIPLAVTASVTSNTNPADKSIIVLPFVNMSNDPEQEYFSDGLTEEIITDLSRLHDLLVISRSSAMTFKNSAKKISVIAGEVHVSYVLEGSVRKAGNSLRITAQLIDANKDAHIWAEKYNGVLEDVFDIQEKVSRAIVDELKVKLSEKEEKDFSQRPIDSIAAYDCYLRAKRELILWNVVSFDKALRLLQSAIEIVGPNPVLYAGLAYTYWSYSNFGIDVDANTLKAEVYVDKAFALDPNSPDAHLALGALYLGFRGEPKLAITHFKKTLAQRPNDYDATLWIYAAYFTMGKMELARIFLKKMQLIEPLGAATIAAPGWIEMYLGNYEAALLYIKRAMTMEPENDIYKFFYSAALLGCEKKNEALEFLMKNLFPGQSFPEQSHFGQVFRMLLNLLSGKLEEAKHIMTPELKAWGKRDTQFSHLFAVMFASAGLKDEAYEWIDNAVNQGFCNYPLLSTKDPIGKLLKGEPRFESLLVRMKQMWEEFE